MSFVQICMWTGILSGCVESFGACFALMHAVAHGSVHSDPDAAGVARPAATTKNTKLRAAHSAG